MQCAEDDSSVPNEHERTLAAGNVRVLLRQAPSASTHTYSARTVSAGMGKSMYRCTTAGSSCDWPVTRFKTPPELRALLDDDNRAALLRIDGAKADAVGAAVLNKRNREVENYILPNGDGRLQKMWSESFCAAKCKVRVECRWQLARDCAMCRTYATS